MDKSTRPQIANEEGSVRSSMDCLSEELEQLHIVADQLKDLLDIVMIPDDKDRSSPISPDGHPCQLVYSIEAQRSKVRTIHRLLVDIKERLRL